MKMINYSNEKTSIASRPELRVVNVKGEELDAIDGYEKLFFFIDLFSLLLKIRSSMKKNNFYSHSSFLLF
eukprot:gene4664-8236_t